MFCEDFLKVEIVALWLVPVSNSKVELGNRTSMTGIKRGKID